MLDRLLGRVAGLPGSGPGPNRQDLLALKSITSFVLSEWFTRDLVGLAPLLV